MSVDAINLHNSHIVTFEPDVLAGKSANVDHAHKIRLARLERNLQLLRVVKQRGLRHRLCTAGVLLAHEEGYQAGHLVMVPVGDTYDDLLVELVLVGVFWVMDDEGPS